MRTELSSRFVMQYPAGLSATRCDSTGS